MKLKLLFFLILSSYSTLITAQSKESILIDSVNILINKSKNVEYTESARFDYSLSANKLAQKINNDSIYLKTNRNLALYYYNSEDYASYISINHKIVKLSKKLNDSLPLARACFGLASVFQLNKINKDSSYFYYTKSILIFDKLKNNVELSYSLGNLSGMQLDAKDYYGADENAVRALNVLKDVEETNDILDQKWILYSRLGSIANALKKNDKAIEYYNEALKTAKSMKDDFNNGLYSMNNIAFVKREQGLYLEAEEIFKDISNEEWLLEDDASFYALILENLAYTKFLTGIYDENEVIELFNKSYRISDSINDLAIKTGAVISLAKFYKGIDNKNKSLAFANEAYNLSKGIAFNDILLESMLLLSELTDGNDGKKYLNEHIKLTDSLLQVERSVTNKYARVELETDKIEAENEQISKENFYLLLLSVGLLLTGILVYTIISQRAKNKELKLVQEQQKANEEIYNLMLGQQDKVEEARAQEKTRVAKDLHDGVLGRLFGVRLSLDSLNFSDGKEAMMNRSNYIGQLKTIEDDIRKISHEMSTDFVSGSGFMDIVTELIENQTKAYGFSYDFNYTDDLSWEFVPNKTKINIYRILQESMQNIYKHADAKHVKIDILREKDQIIIYIVDDGKGFDTTKSKKGIGLKNMSSRVADVKGEIQFFSELEKGTKVQVKIPYLT